MRFFERYINLSEIIQDRPFLNMDPFLDLKITSFFPTVTLPNFVFSDTSCSVFEIDVVPFSICNHLWFPCTRITQSIEFRENVPSVSIFPKNWYFNTSFHAFIRFYAKLIFQWLDYFISIFHGIALSTSYNDETSRCTVDAIHFFTFSFRKS